MKNSALNYIQDVERRHNMSADIRSCGEHCQMLPVGEVGPGAVYPTRVGATDNHDMKGTSPGKGHNKQLYK